MEKQFLNPISEKLFHLSNKIEDFKPQDIVEKLHFENELKNTPFAKKIFRPNHYI